MGTYLRYLPCIDLPERQDKETDSPVSPTPKSRSRIEVRADHSVPNLPYLVPSNIKYVQQSSPVQSMSLSHHHHHHHPMLPVRESSTSQVQLPSPSHPILIPSHPILIPAEPTCVHNNPCEIRLERLGPLGRLTTTTSCKIVPLRRYKYKYMYMYQRYYKLHTLPNMYIGTGTYLKLKPGFAHSSSSCERTPQGGISVGLFQLYTLPATVPVVLGCSNHHHHHHHSTTWFTCTS